MYNVNMMLTFESVHMRALLSVMVSESFGFTTATE